MTLDESFNTPAPRKNAGCNASIVENGYSNLISGVESKARQAIEAKYAEEWNSAGLIRRFKLKRMMNAEIKELVKQLTPKVSPDAIF